VIAFHLFASISAIPVAKEKFVYESTFGVSILYTSTLACIWEVIFSVLFLAWDDGCEIGI